MGRRSGSGLSSVMSRMFSCGVKRRGGGGASTRGGVERGASNQRRPRAVCQRDPTPPPPPHPLPPPPPTRMPTHPPTRTHRPTRQAVPPLLNRLTAVNPNLLFTRCSMQRASLMQPFRRAEEPLRRVCVWGGGGSCEWAGWCGCVERAACEPRVRTATRAHAHPTPLLTSSLCRR